MTSTLSDVIERRRHSQSPAVLLAIGALGFAAVTTQLALTREIMGAFAGDELTIGITLSCWLVLTALGAWTGTFVRQVRQPVRFLAVGVVVVSLVAIAELLLLRAGRDWLFLRGSAVDPTGVAMFCLVLLAPFCLGSGALLIIACHTLAREGDAAAIGRVYSADAVGSIVGAFAFTFLFSTRVDHGVALCWSASAVCVTVAWLGWRWGSRTLLTMALVGLIGFTVAAIAGNVDAASTRWQYRREIVHRASSPYGRLVVTRDAGQLTFFENGVPAIFTANAIQTEELVHYALAQRPDARSVLLIGGAIAGGANDVLRHPGITRVTCVELDPAMIQAGQRLLPDNLSDPRIHVIADDARRFVQRTELTFDVILIALPDPSTYQLNRFYTVEFFASAHRVLAPGGVIAFGCGRYENIVSPELRQIIASARATLAQSFSHVAILPGTRVFFLGSDGPLRQDIATALERQHVHPALVNRHYLDATLAADRLADVNGAAAALAPLNRDFQPVLYGLRLRQWLNQFAFPATTFAVVLGLIVVVSLARLRAVPRMIFTAGFAGAALELALLVALQTYYGALYQGVAAVVAAFMLGLALGAAFANHHATGGRRAVVTRLGLGIAVIAVLLGLGLPALGRLDSGLGSWAGQGVILGATLLLGGLMGAQFAFGSAGIFAPGSRTAPRVFSADLLGAAVGGLAASAFLLPAGGIEVVCEVTAALNVIAAVLSSRSRRDA